MSFDGTKFTPYMQSVMSGIMDRIKTFYCREDVERKVQEVMLQHRKKQSGYHSRLRELNEMCEACGVNAVELCDEETMAAELAKIPTRMDLRKILLTELHEIYLDFPASTRFMERLVRRRLGGEFSGDSLRLAILKKFMRDTDYHTQSVLALAENRLSPADRAEYAALKVEKKLVFVLEHLDEGIFETLKSDVEPLSWLRFLMKHMRADAHGGFAFSPDLCAALGGEGAPLSLLGGLEKRLESGCAPDAAELIAAAEKEFCAYLKQFNYTKKKAKDPSKALGTKDEIYRQAKKDFLKPMKKATTLLKLADDLASGKFRVNGTTKEQLYIFAVAFDMCAGDTPHDESRDIEKNLFHDYYNDNLLRYVLDEEYIRNITSYENEPSGEGINYKNYVEVIYLYYLTKYQQLPPREKLARIHALIERCAKEAKDRPDRVDAVPTEQTAIFKEDYLSRMLQLSNEDELADYICRRYYIHNPHHSSARISYASQRNTAGVLYRELAERMFSEYPEFFGSMYDNVELNNGLDLPALLAQLRAENAGDSEFIHCVLEDAPFISLLEKLDKKLQTKKRRIMTLCENPDAETPECTRTELISLYYCYFRFVLEELTEDFGVMDLPSLYQEFCEGDGIRPGINYYLKESRFQTISPKNAYDMFVVFSLFLELIRWDD